MFGARRVARRTGRRFNAERRLHPGIGPGLRPQLLHTLADQGLALLYASAPEQELSLRQQDLGGITVVPLARRAWRSPRAA